MHVGGVVIDFQKAFGAVHHDILCEQLCSVASNHQQYVSINGFDSSKLNISIV